MKEIWNDLGDQDEEVGLNGIRWLIPISLIGLLITGLLCLAGII